MKTGLIRVLVLMMTLSIPGSLSAYCGWSDIHIATDPLSGNLHESGCGVMVEIGETFRLYFVVVGEQPFDPISRVDVRLSDWPAAPDADQGRMDFSWSATSMTGDLRSGISLRWDPPLEVTGFSETGPVYVLGSVEIESYDPTWLTEPLLLEFDYLESGYWWNDWDEIGELLPSVFGFNMVPGICDNFIVDSPEIWTEFYARHVLPADGSAVPPSFILEFDVIAEWCWYYPRAFTGRVSVFDEVVRELEGIGFESFTVPIQVTGHPLGSPIPVKIDLEFWGMIRQYELDYILDDTAADPMSFSAIKARY